MLQHSQVDILGVLGHFKKLNGNGTNISVYVNYIDDHGNHVSSDLFSVTLFHDAEKVFLRANPRKGDQIVIRNGVLRLRSSGGSVYPNIICNYGAQILVIGSENHSTLVRRAEALQNKPQHYE